VKRLIFAFLLLPAIAMAQSLPSGNTRTGLSVQMGPNGATVAVNGKPLPGSVPPECSDVDCLTRADINAAANAIVAIGQYPCTDTSEKPATCWLKVSIATRSALSHDLILFKPIVSETQIGAPQIANPNKLTNAEMVQQLKWGQQEVPVPGLVKISEADLDLANNPQITPVMEANLSAILKSK